MRDHSVDEAWQLVSEALEASTWGSRGPRFEGGERQHASIPPLRSYLTLSARCVRLTPTPKVLAIRTFPTPPATANPHQLRR